jgi:thiol-disulfide isomerase/thioredoxin
VFAAVLYFLPRTASAQAEPATPDLACRWSAQLTVAPPRERPPSPGDESFQVPFDLLIEHDSGGLRAALLNGSDRFGFSSVEQQGRAVTLRLEQYDATLTAHCTSASTPCTSLAGEYQRQRGSALVRYSLTATCPALPVAQDRAPQDSASARFSIAAEWQFSFASAEAEAPAHAPAAGSAALPTPAPAAGSAALPEPAHFTAQPLPAGSPQAADAVQHVEGTIAPLSGDYGLLAGVLNGRDGSLHLSRFDGIHLLRLDGQFVSPDRIEGVFHDGPGSPLHFVATRSSASAQGFDEAEHLTSVLHPSEPFRFHGVDASSGATVTQSDPKFRGKVVLVDIFGTWCPNCHDEAPVLQSLYARFHARGFEIVGLSYEYVDDPARSRRLLGIYRRKYSIAFPLLLAGTTAPGQIAKTLPQLRNFGAYPTTVFLDRRGRVRLIHAGFSGPATGRIDELTRSFQRTIVKLLDEE